MIRFMHGNLATDYEVLIFKFFNLCPSSKINKSQLPLKMSAWILKDSYEIIKRDRF